MWITQECGQKWYRKRSWRYKKFRRLTTLNGVVIGWAFGPIMVFKHKE